MVKTTESRSNDRKKRVLSPRKRLGPKLSVWVLVGLGIWLSWFTLKPHFPVLQRDGAAGYFLTLLGLLSASGLASWTESHFFYVGRARSRRVFYGALSLTLPVVITPLIVLSDVVLYRTTTYPGDLLLVGTVACAWFLFAWSGSVLIMLLDAGVSAVMSTFRNRVRALVIVLLVLGCGASVVLAPELFAMLNAPNPNQLLDAHHLTAYMTVRFSNVPGIRELTSGSSPGLLFVTIVILLVALPSVASATAKFAGLVVERIYPLIWAFDEVAEGKRAMHVEEGGSKEFRELSSRFNHMVQQLAHAEKMERAFGSYVSQQLLERIRSQQGAAVVAGTARHASVFFADIRGFTQMSEQLSAKAVVQVLNAFFERSIEVVDAHDGYLNKFMGDALMVVFNGPLEQADHRARAIKCAIALSQAVDQLNKRKAFPHVGKLQVGIGVASGLMVCGNVGSEKRLEYTVIGDVVNVASRLCSKAPGGEVWIPARMAEAVHPAIQTRPLEPLSVKGKKEPLEVVAWPPAPHQESTAGAPQELAPQPSEPSGIMTLS